MTERYAIERKVSGQPRALVEVVEGWHEAKERLLVELDERAHGRTTPVSQAAYMVAYRIVDETWPEDCHPTPTVESGTSWAIEVNGAVTYVVRMMAAIGSDTPDPKPVGPSWDEALDAVIRLAEAGDPTAILVRHLIEKDDNR